MKVWIVIYYKDVGLINCLPEILGVYTSLEKAREEVRRYAEKHIDMLDEDDEVLSLYSSDKEAAIDDYVNDNFDIKKWFTDGVLRGE